MSASQDVEGQFALGSRLMAYPESAEDFERGAKLVEAAAERGDSSAYCMMATLEAVGAGRPRSMDRAVAYLRRAVELGSADAEAQLRLLGDSAEAEAIPARRIVSERPRVRLFEGFASAAECSWVMKKIGPKLAPAMVWDAETGRGRVDPVRSNRAVELRIDAMDVVMSVLRRRIAAATRLPEAIFEVPQVMHYEVGQEFRPHHDYLDPHQEGPASDIALRGQRIGTFLIFLNDDFEGGETEFPRANLSIRARAGDALFFANVLPDGSPDPLTVHAGRPPTRGEKWIFSQWIRDRMPAHASS